MSTPPPIPTSPESRPTTSPTRMMTRTVISPSLTGSLLRGSRLAIPEQRLLVRRLRSSSDRGPDTGSSRFAAAMPPSWPNFAWAISVPRCCSISRSRALELLARHLHVRRLQPLEKLLPHRRRHLEVRLQVRVRRTYSTAKRKSTSL
jgi:hypothetical protein